MPTLDKYAEMLLHEVPSEERGPLRLLRGFALVLKPLAILWVGSGGVFFWSVLQQRFNAPSDFLDKNNVSLVWGTFLWMFTGPVIYVLAIAVRAARRHIHDLECRYERDKYLSVLTDDEFLQIAPAVFSETFDSSVRPYELLATIRSQAYLPAVDADKIERRKRGVRGRPKRAIRLNDDSE
jgi:hypothetical protein